MKYEKHWMVDENLLLQLQIHPKSLLQMKMSCQSNGWNDAGWLEEIINTLIHKNASLFPRVCVPQLTVHRAQQPAALRQEMP